MRTYLFNGSISVSCNGVLKSGDIVKGLDNSKIGKDGKPTLCTIKVQDIKEVVVNTFYQGNAILIQIATSNILDYNLYVVRDLQTTDLLEVSKIKFLLDNGYVIQYQSSGARDSVNGEALPLSSQIKLLKHRVCLFIDDKSSIRLDASFRGTHEDFIKYLKDNNKQDILDNYNNAIKLARTK